MTEKRKIFKWAYLIFVGVLAVLMLTCILYVHGLLREYEAAQPAKQAQAAFEKLAAEAADAETFWKTYKMPAVKGGTYEKDVDIRAAYLALYDGTPEIVEKTGAHGEDEMCYVIRKDGFPLAEVTLQANGPVTTKLLVFSTRDWQIKTITPLLEKRTYTVSLPAGFTVSAAGIPLTGTEAAGGRLQFEAKGAYLPLRFEIADKNGEKAPYTIKNFRVIPEAFDYTLTLPATLTVKVNGETDAGEKLSDGRVRHTIFTFKKPEVTVSDLFGNTLPYDGGELPMTYMTLKTPAAFAVTVDGNKVPQDAVKMSVPAEYDILKDLVNDIPQNASYDIAVLKTGASIEVKDGAGKAVALEDGKSSFDLTAAANGEDTVPADIAKQVDVLEVAKTWSMFMSNDRSFAQLQSVMHTGSYAYEMAQRYATSIDRTFFSEHTLAKVPFTEQKVENFVRISQTSFSVDVSFVKHMDLSNGNKASDPMNDRFYFVNVNGKWLLAGLKEVTADA